MYLPRYSFQACHVACSKTYKSIDFSVETTESSGIAYYRTYLSSAWRHIPEAINFITTTVKASNFKLIFTLFKDALTKSDYIDENKWTITKRNWEVREMKRYWLH